jgi:chromosome segregation ATPase
VASWSQTQEQSRSRTAALEDAFRAEEARRQQILESVGGLATQQEDSQRKVEDQAHALERLGEQIGQVAQTFAGQQDALRERVEGLGAAVRSGGDEASRLGALCTQLQEAQQAIRQRLDAQAEVIRALHGAALEQITRKEELRAAVLRLEEIAGALNPVKALPEEL